MKRIALLLTLTALAFGSTVRANAIPSGFGTIRAEIVNQLTIASNNIAGNTNVVANKKLLAPLKKALALIDKPSTPSVINDTKILSLLAPLGKTSLSNTFSPLLNTSLNSYLSALYAAAGSSSNDLAGTFPSGIHTSADKKLIALYTQLLNADNLSDLIAAAKQLAAAAKTLGVVDALVVKAENVPPPKATITGNVTGAVNYSGLKTLGAAITEASPHNFNVYGVKGSLSSSFIFGFTLYGVYNGTSTIVITEANFVGGSFFNPRSFSEMVHGTATVTYNSTAKTMFGTYSFTAVDDDNAAAMITVSGTFTGATLP